MEQPLFFKSGPESLFGVLHTPETANPQAGLVLCHPFGEEKLWAHRASVNFAREAARRGNAALRFDYRGHGDSSGSTENCSLDSLLVDLDQAVATLRRECPSVRHVCLLGLRFGASLASLYANRSSEADCYILIEPIVNGGRYMQELLRINLATQLAVYGEVRLNREALVSQMMENLPVNVDGYLISRPFYEGCNKIDLLKLDWADSGSRVLVMQLAPTESQADKPDLIELVNLAPDSDFIKVTEPPFWREIKPYTSRTRNAVREAIGWWEKCHGC